MIRPLLILLLSLTAFGQPSPINRRAFALASLASPPTGPTNALPLGIYLWWVASDMPTNVVVSNQWADRVQGVLMAQGDPTRRPTNSVDGVYFDGTQFLTNVQYRLDTFAYSVLMIAKNDGVSGGQTIIWDNFNDVQQAIGFVFSAGSFYWAHFNGVYRSLNYTRPNSYLNDMLFAPTNGATHCNFFTNGVATGVDWTEQESAFSIDGIGAQAKATPATFFKGWIREIVIWTNPVASSFSSLNISNIHWYSTNGYPSITP